MTDEHVSDERLLTEKDGPGILSALLPAPPSQVLVVFDKIPPRYLQATYYVAK